MKYDLNSLIENDLIWGTHALGFRRILNIFNSYHPFYNGSISEYIKYSGNSNLLSFHCSTNELVNISKWLLSHGEWDLLDSGFIVNVNAVKQHIISFSIKDFVLINKFDIFDLIKNNNICFIIPEEHKDMFINYIEVIFKYHIINKKITKKQLLSVFVFKDKLYDNPAESENPFYKDYYTNNNNKLLTFYTETYKMLNNNITKYDKIYKLNDTISDKIKETIKLNFVAMFLSSNTYFNNIEFDNNIMKIFDNRYNYSNYTLRLTHPFNYCIYQIFKQMTFEELKDIFLNNSVICNTYNECLDYHINRKCYKPNIACKLLTYIESKYKQIYNDDFPWILKKNTYDNNNCLILINDKLLKEYSLSNLLNKYKNHLSDIKAEELDIFFVNENHIVNKNNIVNGKKLLRIEKNTFDKRKQITNYPIYYTHKVPIFDNDNLLFLKADIKYTDNCLNAKNLYEHVNNYNEKYFLFYQSYCVSYNPAKIHLTLKYHIIKTIIKMLKLKNKNHYIRLFLPKGTKYNINQQEPINKYSIIFNLDSDEDTITKRILCDENYYDVLKEFYNCIFIQEKDLYNIDSTTKYGEKMLLLNNGVNDLSLNFLPGNYSILSVTESINDNNKYYKLRTFTNNITFMLKSNIITIDNILKDIDNNTLNDNFIQNVKYLQLETGIKTDLIPIFNHYFKNITYTNDNIIYQLFNIMYLILYYEKFYIPFNNNYNTMSLVLLFIVMYHHNNIINSILDKIYYQKLNNNKFNIFSLSQLFNIHNYINKKTIKTYYSNTINIITEIFNNNIINNNIVIKNIKSKKINELNISLKKIFNSKDMINNINICIKDINTNKNNQEYYTDKGFDKDIINMIYNYISTLF